MKTITITMFFIGLLLSSSAQQKKPVLKTKPKQATQTKEELFQYLRNKILTLGEGITDVSYDIEKNTITTTSTYPIYITIQYISGLDPNNISWENSESTININIASSKPEMWAALKTAFTNGQILTRIMDIQDRKDNRNLSFETLKLMAKNELYDEIEASGRKAMLIDKELMVQIPLFSVPFNLTKISSEPDFQNKILNAYKKLIKMCNSN